MIAKIGRALLCLTVIAGCAGSLFADGSVQHQQPTLEKGFAAGKMYQFGNLDNVNLFNGNLNVTIPVGQTYSVGGGLSYSFTLMYSGNNWDYQYDRVPYPLDENEPGYPTAEHDKNVALPYEQSNAGLGWSVSLGRMYVPHGQTYWVYESPDGGTHSFYEYLHGLSDQSASDVDTTYSRDNTYIRRKVVRLADQSISTQTLEFPDGTSKAFDGQGRLTKIMDRFSHEVTITYNGTVPSPTAAYCSGKTITESWTVTDTTGRKHYLYFVAAPSYAHVLCEANLAAFPAATSGDGARARFAFSYDERAISRQEIVTEVPSELGVTAQVPLLTELTLPDLSKYSYAYDIGRRDGVGISTKADDPNRALVPNQLSAIETGGLGSFTGHLVAMTLPTFGSLEWSYHTYSFPPVRTGRESSPPYGDKGMRTVSAGVASRTERFVPPGASSAVTRTTTYTSTRLNETTGQTGSMTTVTDPLGNRTESFFSACRDCSISGTIRSNYGLPLLGSSAGVPDSTFNGLFLSSRSYDASGHRLSASYRQYESDLSTPDVQPADGMYDFNRRVVGEVALEYCVDESAPPSGVPACGAPLAVTTNYSDFDGLGHYRTTFTSDYNSTTAGRTVNQAFNRADSAVDSTMFDSGTWPSVTIPALSDPWILGRFSSMTDTRSGFSPLKTLVYFRPDGFLASRRTLANGATAGDHDLYARFSDNGTGEVQLEEYFGGDDVQLLTTGQLKNLSPGTAKYAIAHTYSGGVPATTKYVGATFFSVKNDIDANTGAVSKAYDSANVATQYDYDSSGRLLTATPTGAAATSFTYTNATVSTPASVRVKTISTTGAVEALTQFDPLGRVWREWSRLPSNDWAVRQTEYDEAGRKSAQSQPEEVVSESSTPAVSHKTVLTYDGRGRIIRSLSPDNSTVDTAYGIDATRVLPGNSTGVPLHTVRRTVSIGTQANADGTVTQSPSMTTEYYDAAGRLIQVQEPTGGARATYSYGDTAGHLTTVTMTAADGTGTTQTRQFSYDARGFLGSEQQPELGGTTVYYSTYDARGHAAFKLVGSAANTEYDQKFEYDAMERLKTISARNPYDLQNFRPWKEFTFGAIDSDHSNGKLLTATRHNYHPSLGDVWVRESYTYGDTAGRLTQKVTELFRAPGNSPFRAFTQAYAYNDLGAVDGVTYPACTGTSSDCGQSSWDQLFRGYTNGALTGINAFASLQYGPSGMVTSVTHTNGVVDTIEQDTNGMGRPKSIKFETLTSCLPVSISAQPRNQTAVSGGSATFTVVASGTGITYQWFTEYGQALPGQVGPSLVVGPVTADAAYYVVVVNACSRVQSTVVSVSLCPTPVITEQPSSVTITSGQSTTLSVAANGGTLSYQWYQGSGTGTPVGTGPTFLTPALTTTTSYWVHISNSCGRAVDSALAIVTVPLPVPASLNALANPSGVTVTWSASSGAHHYEIWRRDASVTAYVKVADWNTLSYADPNTSPDFAYAYKVRAVDQNGGSASSFSTADVATRMTFTSLTQGTSTIAASHFEEILTLINRVRAAARSTPVTWTSILPAEVSAPAAGSTVLILRQHLTSLRQAMNTALGDLQVPARTFTDPTLDSTIRLRLVHLTDLRNCAN